MTLDPRIATALRAVYTRLEAEDRLLSSAQLDAAHHAFRARFGPQKLSALQGEELLLAMHSRKDNNSLIYWLEFKNDAEFPGSRLGGIKSGGYINYPVFQREREGTWISGSVQNAREISLAEAISIAHRQREELVKGAALLEALPMGASHEEYAGLQVQIEQTAPSVNNSAWGHKYFSLLFPEKLDDFHNPAYQRYHLIRLLQRPPEGEGRYVCAGRFASAAAELSMRLPHLTDVIEERDGISPNRCWCVATREGNYGPGQWEEMKQGGYIAIGWDSLGDLFEIRSSSSYVQRKAVLKKLLTERIPDRYPNEGAAGIAAGEIHSFLTEIEEGDLVLAIDGNMALGVGRVNGQYFDAAEGKFRHRIPVEWLSREAWRMPDPDPVRSAVRKLQLGKHQATLLEAEKRIAGPVLTGDISG